MGSRSSQPFAIREAPLVSRSPWRNGLAVVQPTTVGDQNFIKDKNVKNFGTHCPIYLAHAQSHPRTDERTNRAHERAG